MSTPNLILITGLPAVGKSFFSHRLSKETGYPVLEKDAYKEILFDDIGFRSREEKVRLGVAAMDLMYSEAARLLDMGISVILDNNFENSSLPGLEALCSAHPCNAVTVRFTAETETVYRRFIARDQNPFRHRGHVLNTRYPEVGSKEEYIPISQDAFEKKFRERGMYDFSFGAHLITVDATDFSKLDIGTLIADVKGYLI